MGSEGKRKPFVRRRRDRWSAERRPRTVALAAAMLFVIGVVTAGMGAAVWELAFGDGDLLGIEAECGPGTSCHMISWGFFAVVPVAAAVVWVLWRLERVRSKYRRYAQDHADELLDTELLSREIVGRDDLCDVLQRDLESRWEVPDRPEPADHEHPRRLRWFQRMRRAECRRPIVLVGGVGSGKTAVLARLTELLAKRHAVPIPIRLRVAQKDDELDLLELARKKFMNYAAVLSGAEADKIWRRMRDTDQIVIVADGLEEALMTVVDTRETAIRAAFEKIKRQNVALIVSSRPHAVLKHLDVATVKLEPLDLRDALRYITGDAGGSDHPAGEDDERAKERSRIRGIARCAELTEMPLFMRIARELYEAKGLARMDARGVDRLGMRVRLIERWISLLEQGKIRPAAPVKPKRRKKVIKELEGIAAFGLMHDSLEVTFKDFTESRDEQDKSDGAAPPDGAQAKESLDTTTQQLREVAADAERLGLVDARAEGVLFRHSVTQAYLGSRRIREVLAKPLTRTEDGDVEKLWNQLENTLTKPGRELLMALGMSCARKDERARKRAIRLLLRNVAIDETADSEKAVYTAAAVVAAASASTDRVPDRGGPDGGAQGVASYERDPGFRDQVILWLKRAECEDAARLAKTSRDKVEETRRDREHAEVRVDEAELKLDDTRKKQAAVSAPMSGGGTARLAGKRKVVADASVVKAEADFRKLRVEAAKARAEHAKAHAEGAIAATIQAEKTLAESEAQPELRGSAELLKIVDDCLKRAIEDVDQSSCERRGAADTEAEAHADSEEPEPRTVRLPRLAEDLVADAVVAWRLLGEARRAEDARSDLLDKTDAYLSAIAGAARLHDAVHHAAEEMARPPSDRHARARLISQKVAPIELDLRGEEGDPALRTELELALHAVVGASEAAARVREEKIDEAHMSLETVWLALKEVEVEVEKWAEFRSALEPLALAAANAVHARRLLTEAEPEPERKASELRNAVVKRLSKVSDAAETASLAHAPNGRPRDTRRATSRTKVLVPLTGRLDGAGGDVDEGIQAAKLDAVARLYDAAQFIWLWKVCKTETDAHVRLTAARKLGSGGSAVFQHLRGELEWICKTAAKYEGNPLGADAAEWLKKKHIEPDPARAYELMGWLLPLLYASIECDTQRSATDDAHSTLLLDWISRAVGISPRADVALAEGMRFAANQRDLPSAHQGILMARAEDLIGETKFWFSKIVLLQALTLWLLPHGGHDGLTNKEMEDRISMCCRHAEHPFVKATIELCVTALREQAPANYIWLDERAVTTRLGASPEAVRASGSDSAHWIPPSAGWLALAPRAQQLLGDVVVYMNLLDRGQPELQLKRFLDHTFRGTEEDEPERVAEQSLPRCLFARGGRKRLDVGRELDKPVAAGEHCDRARCAMRLCPYPGLGEELSRGELSEAFCRRQYELVAWRDSKRPEWQQEATAEELRRFWRAMELRPRA